MKHVRTKAVMILTLALALGVGSGLAAFVITGGGGEGEISPIISADEPINLNNYRILDYSKGLSGFKYYQDSGKRVLVGDQLRLHVDFDQNAYYACLTALSTETASPLFDYSFQLSLPDYGNLDKATVYLQRTDSQMSERDAVKKIYLDSEVSENAISFEIPFELDANNPFSLQYLTVFAAQGVWDAPCETDILNFDVVVDLNIIDEWLGYVPDDSIDSVDVSQLDNGKVTSSWSYRMPQ